MRKLLDAYAILAWLQKEKNSYLEVRHLIEDANKQRIELIMSIINVGEVYYRIARVKNENIAKEFIGDLREMPIEIIPATNNLVLDAALIKSKFPISYADAFAVATAKNKEAILVTGDLNFKIIEKEKIVKIHWL